MNGSSNGEESRSLGFSKVYGILVPIEGYVTIYDIYENEMRIGFGGLG